MNFNNIREVLTWGTKKRLKCKKDIIRNIDELWETCDKIHTKVDHLETIRVHKHDNYNCYSGYPLHDVVIALLQHTGMDLKKRHSLSLEDGEKRDE